MFSRLNSSDNQYVVADFLELECIRTNSGVSSLSYRSLLSISDDEMNNDGIESSDDASVDLLDYAIGECYNRSLCCPNLYPFETGNSSLELKTIVSWHKEIYTFLLLTTRLNMNSQRVQAGYDGTLLFEELCALVAKEYFGEHAQVRVFGTSVRGTFMDKVTNLLNLLSISAQFRRPHGSTGNEKDGSLDIVAWIPFADKKDSQMIALGQCKTGSNWESKLDELSVKDFFENYTTKTPYSIPQKMFFVTESFGDYKWEWRCSKANIMFDRTRIMEYLPLQMDMVLLEKIIKWNQSALNCVDQIFNA